MSGSEPGGDPTRIGETFRNGSITAVGVFAGFSLTFLTAWSASPIPWKPPDVSALAPLVVGVALQLWALAGLLDPDSLLVVRYRRATRIFLAGVFLTVLGVAAALAIDIAPLSEGL
jgi:hypothetical protein